MSQDDQIYSQMFSALLEQRLSPGTKLSEDTLGEIFGVSRTVIRKVLQRLAHEKVVCIMPNRGAFVAEPTPEEARDVLAARKVIEEGIMRNVVKKCTAADIRRLEVMLKEEKLSLEKEEHSKWVALSGDFHLALAAISGSQSLEDFLRELVSRTSLIHVQYQSRNAGVLNCSCEEHEDIIEAIRSADEEKAVNLMMSHLDEIEESLNLDGDKSKSDLYAIFGGNK